MPKLIFQKSLVRILLSMLVVAGLSGCSKPAGDVSVESNPSDAQTVVDKTPKENKTLDEQPAAKRDTAPRIAAEATQQTEVTLMDSMGYHVTNNGQTIYDSKRNLTWMRCSLGQAWDGETCTGEAKGYSWDAGTEAALKLTFAGKNDWRLPTKDELNGLVYCGNGVRGELNNFGTGGKCEGSYKSPTIVQAAFPNTPAAFFWTSTPHADSSGNAWYIYFNYGNVFDGSKGNSNRVRLVRTGK